MRTIMATSSNRPISPHLQVYRWGPHMLVSILHRATGDGMAIVGSLLLLWWLGSLASGPAAYAQFIQLVWQADPQGALTLSNWIGRAVLIGLSWAFFQHLATGIRHLLLDTGAGYELRSNRLWSLATIACALSMTGLFWLVIFGKAL